MIVDCFSYFFGLESIKKYLSKKTIVVETIIETDDIPIPSVLMRKILPKATSCNNPNLTRVDCIDSISFQIDEILNVFEDDNWKRHFDSVSEDIVFIVTPTTNLTSKKNTTYSISFNSSYLLNASSSSIVPFDNGVSFPEILLYDPKYRRMIPNLVNIPQLILEYLKFVQGTEHYIYLKVRKITKLNHVNRPCEEDSNYNMSVCVAEYMMNKVGCTLDWNFYANDKYETCNEENTLR